MKPCTLEHLHQLFPDSTIVGDPGCRFDGFTIDSRKIEMGNLFIALMTDRDDGHNYLAQAQSGGAACALVSRLPENSERWTQSGFSFLVVKDTLSALSQMASTWRKRFNGPVIAVTGSSGKTTVCRMIATCGDDVNSTRGNFNNHIGLPISLLSSNHDAAFSVFELGMSGFGEIAALGRILQPTIGVITNIGTAHIGLLGSREGIMQAKLELAASARTLIVDGDDPALLAAARHTTRTVIATGFGAHNDVRMKDFFSVEGGEYLAQVVLPGALEAAAFYVPFAQEFQQKNLLLAAAALHAVGIPYAQMFHGWRQFQPAPLRWEVHHIAGNVWIFDCYNANPDSMKQAVAELLKLPAPRIAILGEMRELGNFSDAKHREVARSAHGLDFVVTYGEGAQVMATELGAKAIHCTSYTEIVAACAQFHGATFLVKGSRANQLERILPLIAASNNT
ncbi:UDP-N-acetylmuramoyl-tripeptide--D-alanyl-D-alanine ligase [Chrysiogenes arsenatis]|uniref:UDP-N-acetylmuramoyl-tripeptide--D-alanyl-D- alanine ligase n=1 Tax=Chrysiogenes arsenatis TaxID=309797 RepID=UPI0003FD6302|nr:UDP-N-acetylmuramoyl-tripeptide--D-alanyl-D-alanine ligase [Chrysiogenes arsenatis]